ncbi:hypothetical protein [Actinopolymorpha alba]|uniref:hypothetical protein n=1 Tax=Actinopolymorpha alba TaxID=533267 RepID=UPI00038186C4|nr:hypothetical protein [Actinopolymorpha alba]
MTAVFVVLGACGGAGPGSDSTRGGTTSATPAGTPTTPATPASRTPAAADPANLDCRPRSTPESPPPRQGSPKIVSANAVDCEITPGGGAARFQLVVANPSGRSFRDGRLAFSYAWGGKPEDLRLEYLDGSTWKRLAMSWNDPEEPELLESAAIPVAFAPRQTRTFDLRVSLPADFATSAGEVSFGGGASLRVPGGKGREFLSVARGLEFALNPSKGTPVNLRLPHRVTPGQAPVEFPAYVDNTTGRAYIHNRLDLTIDGVYAKETRLEVFRDGAWHPVTLVETGTDGEVAGSITSGFNMPYNFSREYRLRIRLGFGATRWGANPLMSLALVNLDARGRDANLGQVRRLLHVNLPAIQLRVPDGMRAPGSVEIPVSFENSTSADYPPLHVELTITNPPRADWLRVRYREVGTRTWNALTPRRVEDQFNAWAVDLPPPRAAGTPSGFHVAYDVQVGLTRWDPEVGNLIHVAAVLKLADGSVASPSTLGATNGYIGVEAGREAGPRR